MTKERESAKVSGGPGIIASGDVSISNVKGQLAIGEKILQTIDQAAIGRVSLTIPPKW